MATFRRCSALWSVLYYGALNLSLIDCQYLSFSEAAGWRKMVCYEVIALGIFGAIAATISALNAIFSTSMAVPCYL